MFIKRLALTFTLLFVTSGYFVCHAQGPIADIQSLSVGAADGILINNIEVTAIDYAFKAPKVIPSGWTTIKFKNDGKHNHFLFMSILPDNKTMDDYINEVGIPIDKVWKLLKDGEISKPQAGKKLGEVLPEWYGSLTLMGGPGIIKPGGSLEYTANLKPGNYVLECYMKTPEGEFHALEGMTRELTVTEEERQGTPPKADITLTLTNYDIVLDGDLTPGKKTIAVNFKEHPEVGFGHDIHLARLNSDTDIDSVAHWIDFLNVDGLVDPAPATFLGGTHEGPVGSTAYFEVDLTPGRYLLISELTNPAGMIKEFFVK